MNLLKEDEPSVVTLDVFSCLANKLSKLMVYSIYYLFIYYIHNWKLCVSAISLQTIMKASSPHLHYLAHLFTQLDPLSGCPVS